MITAKQFFNIKIPVVPYQHGHKGHGTKYNERFHIVDVTHGKDNSIHLNVYLDKMEGTITVDITDCRIVRGRDRTERIIKTGDISLVKDEVIKFTDKEFFTDGALAEQTARIKRWADEDICISKNGFDGGDAIGDDGGFYDGKALHWENVNRPRIKDVKGVDCRDE